MHALPYTAENEASVKEFFEKIPVGRLDYLVHSAGISPDKAFNEQTAADWNKVLSVNMTGTFLATRYAQERMK